MLSFTKVVPNLQSRYVRQRIQDALTPLSDDTEISEENLTFNISPFAPFIAYSRYVAFSKVIIVIDGQHYTLRLMVSKMLFFPFLIFMLGCVMFISIGSITLSDIAAIVIIPILISSAALADSTLRTLLWWRSL